MNYARELPKSKNEVAYENAPPAFTSYQSQNGAPIAFSVISLSDKTTVIEISAFSGTAGGGGIIGKWGSASVTGTNFDFFINSGLTRQFVIPVSIAGVQSVAGANVANGLYNAVAVKFATVQSASVFSTEY